MTVICQAYSLVRLGRLRHPAGGPFRVLRKQPFEPLRKLRI